MNTKKLILILSALFTNTLFSQSLALNLGYNLIGKSAFYSGLEARLNKKKFESKNLGIGAYLTTNHQKLALIPELHYNQTINKSSPIMLQFSVSTKNIKPSIGLNVLNAVRLDLGYSFGFNKTENFKGFGFGINVLLTGNNNFYDHLKLMF